MAKPKAIVLDFTPAMEVRLKVLKKIKCASLVMTTNARGRNNKHGDKCANLASIYLNGTPMCVRHAQHTALNILINNKLAEIL